jgi:hypothetical protein
MEQRMKPLLEYGMHRPKQFRHAAALFTALLGGCTAYGVPPPGTRSISGEVQPPPSIAVMMGIQPAPGTAPAAAPVAASPAPSAPSAAAPVATGLVAAPAPGRAGFDGVYAGTGTATRDVGSTCDTTIKVTGMNVSGGDVAFGDFHGKLNFDGGVQMQYGRDFVNGYFYPDRFDGSLFQPFPGCTYHLVLTRQ